MKEGKSFDLTVFFLDFCRRGFPSQGGALFHLPTGLLSISFFIQPAAGPPPTSSPFFSPATARKAQPQGTSSSCLPSSFTHCFQLNEIKKLLPPMSSASPFSLNPASRGNPIRLLSFSFSPPAKGYSTKEGFTIERGHFPSS